jgi:hypothetical protein
MIWVLGAVAGWVLSRVKYCIVLYREYLNWIIWHCYAVYSLIIIPAHLKRHFFAWLSDGI